MNYKNNLIYNAKIINKSVSTKFKMHFSGVSTKFKTRFSCVSTKFGG